MTKKQIQMKAIPMIALNIDSNSKSKGNANENIDNKKFSQSSEPKTILQKSQSSKDIHK